MSALDFDIDHYLNRFVPAPRLYILPTPISWFLGYRSKPRSRTSSLVIWLWAFTGAFCGIAIVECVYRTEYFKKRGTPLVIASFVCHVTRKSKKSMLSLIITVGRCRNSRIQHHRFPSLTATKCNFGPTLRFYHWRRHNKTL